MGNLFDKNGTCFECYDEGVIGWANGEDFDTEFCSCSAGVKLEKEYAEWYAETVMNEFYKENA
jgi:hypothetical protein